MIKAYVFDFDGTMADSMPVWSKAMMSVVEKSGVAYPENIIEILTPLGDNNASVYLREKLGVKFSCDEIKSMIAEYTTPIYHTKVQPKEGFLEYLKLLKANGKKTAVLTASTHRRIDECIRRWGVYDLFDCVKTCEDYGIPKSNPEIYALLSKDLGCKTEEIAFFDDNLEVNKTVKQAGLLAVGVYDDSAKSFVAQIKEVADYYIESFSDAKVDL